MASADRPHPVTLAAGWSPASWRERPAAQMPQYPDADALAQAMDELRALPPLVTSWEILALKQQVAEAQEGRRFLLLAGYPSITVPAGFAHELPVGIVFMGAAWSEPTLIGIAYGYEQATHARRPPKFLPTLAP